MQQLHMNDADITIVIPMYNSDRFIAETIQSVLNQTYKNFKLIIIDDKSDDKSFEIASSFDDSRITVIKNDERLGFFKNWNKCLTLINTKYGKILPHDDILHSKCLETQVSILSEYKKVSFVCCNRNIIGPNGKVIFSNSFIKKSRIINLKNALKKIFITGTNIIGEPGTVLFKTSAAKKIGGFSSDNEYTIDIDYWVRLLNVGDGFIQKEILCSFRIWDQSTSINLKNNQAASMKKFLTKLYQTYPKHINKNYILIGNIMCHLNQMLRKLIYRFIRTKS